MTQHNKKLVVKAGAGKIVEGIMQLEGSYKEAADAFSFIDIAADISYEGNAYIMMFSDLGIFKLLCQVDDPALLMEYVPESLQKLFNYKKPQQEDLIITLKTYLNYNQNLSKTAQDLYVHYKTAAYRIGKIAKITGIDFDNANERLAVRIGLVVYRMIENFNKK
ncbi:PucR family transcriptional regulator [Lacrimispora xylanisolvens]|uniref:PucR family transcriptional regulator n=1 Tax=Lacrimispora xylanisolvens TaxID=384636 RepID=UPI002402C155